MTQKISISNGELNYQLVGSGETIVFIHGFSLDQRVWQPQVEHFQETHQVLTYDCRGFGQSSLPTHPYRQEDDLYQLLKHLHIEQAHIVGHSMGGRIAIDFAIKYPKSVKTLTLIASALDGYASTVDWSVPIEKGVDAAIDSWLHHPVFEYTNQNKQVSHFLRSIVNDYSGWHWLHPKLETKLDPPSIDRLSEITAPTLIIVGEKDLTYFDDIAQVLAGGIPHSKYNQIPECGHMVNVEIPEHLNHLITNHITSNENK